MQNDKIIFFVNPDPKLIAMYETPLKQYFSFDSARDGLTAIRKIRLNQPQIIISEYMLPRLSGLGLLKYVRSDQGLHRIPFLFFTNHDDPSAALNASANDWIHRQSTPPQTLIDKVYYHLKINQPILS